MHRHQIAAFCISIFVLFIMLAIYVAGNVHRWIPRHRYDLRARWTNGLRRRLYPTEPKFDAWVNRMIDKGEQAFELGDCSVIFAGVEVWTENAPWADCALRFQHSNVAWASAATALRFREYISAGIAQKEAKQLARALETLEK